MDRKHGVLLILGTAIISGFSIFINKFSVASMDSSVFTFLKNTLVAFALLSVVLLTREVRSFGGVSGRQWLKLVMIGLVGGSIPFLLFFKGLTMTSAALGAFIHKTLFIYASVFAFIFLREKLSWKLGVAAVLLLLGNFFLLRLGEFSLGLGAVLIFLATVLWAGENVLSKHMLADLPGNIVAFSRMFFGSMFIFLFLLISGKAPLLAGLSFHDMWWTVLTAFLLLLFVMTYYNGLKYVQVSVATSILLLGSPITTLLSLAFLDATVALSQLLGIVLTVAGIVFAIFFVEFPQRIRSVS